MNRFAARVRSGVRARWGWTSSRALTTTLILLRFVGLSPDLISASFSADFLPTAQERIVPPETKVETLWLDGEFTEGPAADADGAILFSDIGNRILRFDPATGATRVFREPSGRANGLCFDQQGRLIACEGANSGGGRRLSITERDGQVRTLADRWQGRRLNSPNDLAIDKQGRVFFSDPRYVGDEPRDIDFEGVFVVTPDGQVTLATSDVKKPNGIALSPDNKVAYVADTEPEARRLLRFSIAPNGQLVDRQVMFDFGDDRGIDGMKVDLEGNIYCAAGRGDSAGIYVFSASGAPLALIPLVGTPANCAFGRHDERSVLYITGEGPAMSAPANDATSKAERKHGLFRVRLRIPGSG